MRKYYFNTILLFIFLIFTISSLNKLNAQALSKKSAGDLIWSDEFDGTVINTAKWDRPEYNRRNNDKGPDGWWSKEDSYLDGNGNLIIRVRKIPNKNTDTDSCDYSVGAVRTYGKFSHLYGKYEIRCKLPTQSGWWVAFWMMQGNVGSVGNEGVDGTEVDIMEGFGWTNKINNAFHWDGYGDFHKSTGRQFYPTGIRTGFHTFTLEWYPQMYVFFIDGKETFRSVGGGVCNQKGYVKVTGEISSEDWATNSYWSNKITNSYPDSFMVDYVRVYEIGDYKYPVGISDVIKTTDVTVFPNPSSDFVTISWDADEYAGKSNISFINSTGQLVKSLQNIENNTNIPVRELPKGLYFISIKLDSNTGYLKFLKE